MAPELPVVPDRCDVVRQRRQGAKINPRLGRAMEIGAARGQETIVGGDLGVISVLIWRMAAGHDLDRDAAELLELIEESIESQAAQFITPRMRHYRQQNSCEHQTHERKHFRTTSKYTGG